MRDQLQLLNISNKPPTLLQPENPKKQMI
jgi:hypothetical protein